MLVHWIGWTRVGRTVLVELVGQESVGRVDALDWLDRVGQESGALDWLNKDG